MKTQDSIRGLLIRDLRALARQLDAYEDESQIWQLPAGISNSAGNLALHLVGNLQAFIGANLGDSGFVRDRPAEFSRRDVDRAEIRRTIEQTIDVVSQTLEGLSDERLQQVYPESFGELRPKTLDFLIHLATHLAFHLGQIDYHRRLVTGHSESIAPIAISELASVVDPN